MNIYNRNWCLKLTSMTQNYYENFLKFMLTLDLSYFHGELTVMETISLFAWWHLNVPF